jgi:hypothetical protein
MRQNVRLSFVLGCVVIGCVSVPVLAIQARAEHNQVEIVGVIGKYQGNITDFKFSRAGQKGQAVKVLMPLQEGDQITAQADNRVLTIFYTDATTKEIRKENSPFPVEAHGRTVSLGGKLLRGNWRAR